MSLQKIYNDPELYVSETALCKAMDVTERLLSTMPEVDLIISADTVVSFNGILEKPLTTDHAFSTLKQLSGNTHEVLTAVVIVYFDKVNKKTITKQFVERTSVTFMKLTDSMISDYISTGEPMYFSMMSFNAGIRLDHTVIRV